MSTPTPPSLQDYFESFHEVLIGAEAPEDFAAHHSLDAGRVSIYPFFVHRHIESILRKVYTLLPDLVGADAWKQAVDAYAEGLPMRHYELNQCAQPFARFVAGLEGTGPWQKLHAELAVFEWLEFEVYAADIPLPAPQEVPQLNPTLQFMQSQYALPKLVRGLRRGTLTPEEVLAAEPTPTTVILYRHPKTLLAKNVRGSDPRLFAFKLVHDGMSVESAAAESGLEPERIQELLVEAKLEGYVI